MLRKLDERVMEVVQIAYLWLLDRCGVYVATVMFTETSLDVFCRVMSKGYTGSFDFLMLGTMGIISAVWYNMQSSGNDRYNRNVLEWRDHWMRHAGTFLALFLGASNALHLAWWGLASCAFWLSWNYTATVLIRDREPPPKHEMKLATEGAR